MHLHIIDLVFLDISLTTSKDRKLVSVDGLVIKLKSLFPKVKNYRCYATHLENNYRLVNILKTIKDTLLLKTI